MTKEAIKRNRLDLYDRIYHLRDENERIRRIHWTESRIWFQAMYNSIALNEISNIVEHLTIKWLKQVIAVHTSMLNEIKEEA